MMNDVFEEKLMQSNIFTLSVIFKVLVSRLTKKLNVIARTSENVTLEVAVVAAGGSNKRIDIIVID